MRRILADKWRAETTVWLAGACDETYPLEQLRKECEGGRVTLFNVYEGEHCIGAFAVRIDQSHVREMVVVAAGGHMKDFCKSLTPFVERLAAENNCTLLRAHTDSPAQARLLGRAGWIPTETVLRKSVGC